MTILPFDEINAFKTWVREVYYEQRNKLTKDDEEDIIDELLDLFLLAYAQGNLETNKSLSSSYQPTLDEVMETVDREIAGKTWKQRVEEIFSNGGGADEIIRIAETETHRDANEAALKSAKKANAKSKTWVTMLDDKVRDTHFPLEGQTIPIDADFYTYDGDMAQAPGLFTNPENNVNCRCELRFSKEK